MIKHFAGELGCSSIYCSFDYDDSEFEIKSTGDNYNYLKYIGDESKPIILPDGCICCDDMFVKYSFKNKDSLKNFDTSKVVSMQLMFEWCKFPEGFTLGDKFNTSSVENMNLMFYESMLPEGFTLGDKFDTSSVKFLSQMFCNCGKLPVCFTLGDKFDTHSAININSMFYGCSLQEGFTLGDKFDTSNVEDMRWLFAYCKLPEGFSFGNKFNTYSVKYIAYMFCGCEFPEVFTLGDEFDVSHIPDVGNEWDEEIGCMFLDCNLPEDVLKKSRDEIIEYLRGKDKDYINCKKELLKFLKEGKYLKEAKMKLSKSNIKSDVLESVSKEIVLVLSVSCVKDVNIFFTKKNGTSKYTVGEIRKKLIEERGYPEEVVNKCIVDYLENQYLCD